MVGQTWGPVGTDQIGTDQTRRTAEMDTRLDAWADGRVSDSVAASARLFRRLKILWLMGVLILLPFDLVRLPLNVTPVDIWIVIAMPILWLYRPHGVKFVSFSYMVAIWIILIASFASTFYALAPRNGFVVIVKEVYIFFWFFTVASVVSSLTSRQLRRLFVVWSVVVFAHGLLLLAQFASQDIWHFIARIAGNPTEYDLYRPAGLFMNANSAAFFQCLGFAPLMLISRTPRTAVILGVCLLPTMLVTGSMGATLGLIAAVTVGLGVLVLSGHGVRVVASSMQLLATLALLGGLVFLVVNFNAGYKEHFEHIFLGRAERSSEGRLYLWQRGFDAFLDHGVYVLGVGPENFREVDGRGKQLHNDFMAFLVERGFLGVIGLVLLAAVALSRSVQLILLHRKYPDRIGLEGVIFLAALCAAMVESLTHQFFHFRELWLLLAFQEGLLLKMEKISAKAKAAQYAEADARLALGSLEKAV